MLRDSSRWRYTRVVTALVVSMGVGGCLLINDFDEVTGGASAVTPEAAPPPDDPIPDAAELPDAEAPVDAGFSCANHRECLTFDDEKLEGNGWNATPYGTGTIELDKALFVSPPAGARTTMEATDGGNAAQNGAILDKTVIVDPAPAHLRWGFDINIGECSVPSPGGGSITLTSVAPSTATAFGLIVNTSNDDVFGHANRTSGVFTSKRLTRPLPRRTWAHLDFDLIMAVDASTATLFVDGEQRLSAQLPGATPGSSILLNLGSLSSGAINRCDVAYDNYYFDVVP